MTAKFLKRPKLNWMNHLFLLLFIIGILNLHWFGWRLVPWNIPIWTPFALYALFFLATEFPTTTKGQIYQAAMARQERKYATISANTESTPKISKTDKKVINFKTYIEDRKNHNLFIAGSSGTGKTTLMRYLIGLFPNSVKTIFSFKARDDYLKLGIPILKVSEHAGDPFQDKEAFVQSFCVTYPMNTQGVTAASIPSILRTTLRTCNTWKELNAAIESEIQKEKPGSFTHSAYTFIQQKLADLELKTQPYGMDYGKDAVLDFSGLNESAKTFYGEFYLRQAWHNIEAGQENPMKHIVVIDEVHRLLKSEATVFGEVARLIRARGALWCGTQNYADLPDFISNQFAIHLLFNTRSKHDIQALEAINYLLPFVVTEMPDHHFTDAATRELHDAVPIFTANIGKFKDYPETYLQPTKEEMRQAEEEGAEPMKLLDYKEKVLAMLEQEASWSNELARRMAEELKIDKENAKPMIGKALHALEKEGLVGKENIKMADKEVVLYYRRDSSLSGLHKYMVETLTKKHDEAKKTYKLPNGREGEPDISTEEYDIEVETGLKNDLKTFAQRLSNKTKKTYVVVPNDAEKERYQKAINNPLVTIFRLDEF